MPEAAASANAVPRVLALSQDPASAITRIRLGESLQRLQARGALQARQRGFGQSRRADLAWADVLLLQRPLSQEAVELQQRCRGRGLPVVVELDDLLIAPAAHLLQRQLLLQARPRLLALLAAADLLTVSTAPLARALADALGPAAPPLLQVPNAGMDWAGTPARHDDRSPLTLLLVGSDLQQLGALGPALQALPWQDGRLRLCCVGPIGAALQGLALPAGLPHQALPLLSRSAFLDTLAALPNPVGLMPLDDSDFSRCKSAVKYFDYAMAGIPSLCAWRSPYAEVLHHGQDGWLCGDDPADWTAALQDALGPAGRRQAVADAARRQVLAHHGPAQQDAAWQAALTQAAALRRRPTPNVSERLVDALADAASAPSRWLQAANRARLARRRRR